MRASLHRASLHYGGDILLYTASSGSVLALDELYLRLDDGKTVGVGEVRLNITYLNNLEPEVVIAEAIAAVEAFDWTNEPRQLLHELAEGEGRWTAPVRTLLDCALHDLIAQREGMPLCRLLGGPVACPTSMETNQTLFWSSHDRFVAQAAAYVARGFRSLKVRVAAASFDADVERIRYLRQRFGPSITIAADANGKWSETEARDMVNALAAFDLAYLEQPIEAGNWDRLRRLAEVSPVPIMLDESITSAEDIERITAAAGKLWAHLKLIKMGGVGPTVAAARQLARAGIPFMIGQMNEGGAATAAALHVAAATSPAFAELYGADNLLDDPVSGVAYANGLVSVGQRGGLGVAFDPGKAHLIWEF